MRHGTDYVNGIHDRRCSRRQRCYTRRSVGNIDNMHLTAVKINPVHAVLRFRCPLGKIVGGFDQEEFSV